MFSRWPNPWLEVVCAYVRVCVLCVCVRGGAGNEKESSPESMQLPSSKSAQYNRAVSSICAASISSHLFVAHPYAHGELPYVLYELVLSGQGHYNTQLTTLQQMRISDCTLAELGAHFLSGESSSPVPLSLGSTTFCAALHNQLRQCRAALVVT